MRVTMPKCIPIAQGHPTTVNVTYRIRKNFYDFMQSRDFDARLFDLLDEMSTGEQDGYKQVQFSEQLLRLINRVKYRPKFLPAPLYWDNKEIKSLFLPRFFARYEVDCFGHKAILMRQDGVDYYFAKLHKAFGDFYPTFTQPFAAAKGVEKHFEPYGSDFAENYRIMQGLFLMWYGFTF